MESYEGNLKYWSPFVWQPPMLVYQYPPFGTGSVKGRSRHAARYVVIAVTYCPNSIVSRVSGPLPQSRLRTTTRRRVLRVDPCSYFMY